jgi:hypothetical protein
MKMGGSVLFGTRPPNSAKLIAPETEMWAKVVKLSGAKTAPMTALGHFSPSWGYDRFRANPDLRSKCHGEFVPGTEASVIVRCDRDECFLREDEPTAVEHLRRG